MIKRDIKIKAVAIALALAVLMPHTAQAGIKNSPGKRNFLPPIVLKGLEFKGTMASGLFEPIAIVEDTRAGKNYWYKVGDTLGGGRIVEIKRGAVVLEIKGSKFLFGMPEGAVAGTETAAITGGKEAPEVPIETGTKVGDNKWDLKIDTAVNILTKAGKIIKDARIRPYFAIGRAAGVRVDRIKDRSVIKKMGIEDGDIIKGVNGFGLASPTKVFEAYRKYKKSNLIEVQVLRNNEPTTLTYNIVR
jgi:general secretion pathway protein C